MTGVGMLLGQRVRRDRRQLLIWIAGAGLLAYVSHVGVEQSFGTPQERAAIIATALANPVVLLFRGLPSGTEHSAVMAFLILPWLALLAALMASFLAVRHTRGEEESGRGELVSATRAGRTAPIVSTTLHGLLANLALAAVVAAGFLASGSDPTGSVLAGLAAGATGVAFLGVGLLAAQLVRTARVANAIAVWTLLVSFAVCGIGNALGTPSADLTRMESSWLTWLSPFGWAENVRPFDRDDAWPLLLGLGVGAVLAAAAIALVARRDLGDAFVPERRGRAAASRALNGPTGLVWRLTRDGIAGWAVGGLLTGILSTTLAGVVEEIGADNPAIENVLRQISGAGADLEQATITTFFTLIGVLAACCAVQVVCRARQEEIHGTAEPVRAAVVARVRWLSGYLAVAFVGVVAVTAAGAAGAAVGIASGDGDPGLYRAVAVVGGGQVAAASVFPAVTALAFALAPRVTIPLGWSLVAVGTTLGLFGPVLGLPAWATDLSPISVSPVVAGDAVDPRGLPWLVGAVVVGVVAALALMRRRELETGG